MIDYDRLKSMPYEEGRDYLTQLLSGGLGEYVPGTEGSGVAGSEAWVPGTSGYYKTLGPDADIIPYYADNPAGITGEGGRFEGSGVQTGRQAIIEGADPTQSYVADFDMEGNLTGVGRQIADSWYDRPVGPMGLPLGALLPLAGAAAGSYFPGTEIAAAEGAAPIVSGAAEGAVTGGAGADLLAGSASAGGAGVGGAGGVGTGFGQIGSGTFGMNAAYTPAALAAAEAATLPVLTPAMTSLGYTALPGAAALGAGTLGLAAGPGAAGTMSFLDASKAAIAAGAPAGGSGGILDALTTGARDVWNTGKAAYTAVKPVLDTGKKIVDVMTGGSKDSSSGLLGGLGGIGGILGLALLMAQLRKDRNAPAANATPVIPRLRSRVEQKPFTLDAQGNKQAPLAYFGQPVYYAAGGGIGGLAAGGQASRAVRGPGDGVSDSIPASINGEEPAALADGEFVIDARTVAELGNGSTEAGTRKLEAMVNRVHHARAKARRGEDSGADRHMPA